LRKYGKRRRRKVKTQQKGTRNRSGRRLLAIKKSKKKREGKIGRGDRLEA
jgi:hypothetical protein